MYSCYGIQVASYGIQLASYVYRIIDKPLSKNAMLTICILGIYHTFQLGNHISTLFTHIHRQQIIIIKKSGLDWTELSLELKVQYHTSILGLTEAINTF